MNDYQIDWHVRIPLRDGVHLHATIYRPVASGPTAVIASMTPYTADSFHERAVYYAARGLAFALVDVRGRGASEGAFEPFVHEGDDGHDVVEWLAAQSWCTSDVAMWGGSYGGMVQWYTAATFPPHLRTIAPAAASWVGLELPFPGGIYNTWTIRWLTLTSGRAVQWNAMADLEYWSAQFARRYREHRPFAELAADLGNTSTAFDRWLAHPTIDDYWNRLNPTPEHFARMTLPVLSITGLYDGATIGVFEFYRRHIAAVAPAIADQHFLVIGPWDHGGTRAPQASVGSLTFGPQSLLDIGALHIEWYSWAMNAGPKPRFFRDRIAYYVTGLEEWRFAHSLDEMTTSRRRYALDAPNGEAHDVFRSGSLIEDGRSSPPVTFRYDPLDVRPGDLQRLSGADVLTDQTAAFNLFGNGLIYHSEPFTADCVVIGEPKIVLYLSIDVPDTDLAVRLYEIRPDGTALLMGDDRLRARFRGSLEREELIRPGEVLDYRFEHLKFVSRRIARYSRLRLIITSPNSIFEQKNYNSGGDIRFEGAADARVAHVTVHHADPHRSFVEIPFGDLTSNRTLAAEDAHGLFTATEMSKSPG